MAADPDKKLQDTEVRAALEQILASEDFRRSRRMCSLLEYLVNESLAGRGDKIKATSIAIDVFGRDGSFDQQSDPIVRVEAGRLRQRLGDYYRGTGGQDRLRIEIPKGAYVPKFIRRPGNDTATQEGSPAPASSTTGGISATTWIAFFAGLVAAGLIYATVTLVSQNQSGSDTLPVPEYSLAVDESKPYIVVNSVAANPGDEQGESLAAGLTEALITNLSKLSGLSVMAHASVIEASLRVEPLGITDFRSKFGVTHLLRGTVESESERAIINVQLVDAKTAKILWAERISRPLSNIIDLEEELALTIAQQLAVQLQPGERARLSQYHSSSFDAWLLYRQGLITIMPPRDLARVHAARQLFDRASQLDPGFAGGFAGLSFAHSTRVLFMNTTEPEVELAAALQLADKAIELDPEFGAGYAVLALAQVLDGDNDNALRSASKSEQIQPGDAFAHFVRGMSLIIAERPLPGISHLKEALRLDPLESRMPYLNLIALGYYTSSDYSRTVSTVEQNYARGGPRGPHMNVILAAAYAQLGEEAKARQVAGEMMQKHPEFPYRPWLARWLYDENQLSQTIELLQGAGVTL